MPESIVAHDIDDKTRKIWVWNYYGNLYDSLDADEKLNERHYCYVCFTIHDCTRLANKLILELELNVDSVDSIIEIDSEFIYSIIKKVFSTNLLPEWTNIDCLNETEEFQFIISILEQIFDLDLGDINPAYLTLRKPEYVYLVLNALLLAKNYIKKDEKLVLSDLSDISELSISSRSSDDLNEDIKQNLPNGFLTNSSDETSSIPSEDKKSDKKQAKNNKKVQIADRKKINQIKDNLFSKDLNKKDKELKIYSTNKELTDEELEHQLKELRDNKKLINNLTAIKKQNFALEISYQILDAMKIQEKSNEIKTNLIKLKTYEPRPNEKTMVYNLKNQFDQSKFKKVDLKKKKSLKQNSKILKKSSKKERSPNLDELLNKLTGLSIYQINELKDKTDYQKQLINNVKFDLIKAERNLKNQILIKVEKENKLLEILQKDLNLNLNLSNQAKNRLESEKIKAAKYELRKERADLKKEVDEYLKLNLSTLKKLETEQDRELKKFVRKKDELLKQDLSEIRNGIKEYNLKIKGSQRLLIDNFDNLYSSQASILVEQETNRKKFKILNEKSLTKHLEQSFKSKLFKI